MHTWITHPLTLESESVRLIPLEESHLPALEKLARDPRIWEFYPTQLHTPEKFASAFRTVFAARDGGTQYPFVIYHRGEERIIGSTRLMDIHPEHRKLEIGWTWLSPAYWGSGINRECKGLLLTYCFEALGAARVQLKTDEINLRSRRAIEKTGARFEGILRNDMIRDNGTYRNSAYFSIIEAEWPQQSKILKEAY